MLVQNRQLVRFSSFFLVLCLLSYQFLLIAPTHASASIIRDTELERGFGEIIHDLAEKAGFPQSVKVRIVNDPTYNAFVVGGRTVYVHTGLLLQARSAEEILGVIAHEIGHLAAGHVPLRSEDIKNAGIANALAAVAAAAAGAHCALLGRQHLGGRTQGGEKRQPDHTQWPHRAVADFARHHAGCTRRPLLFVCGPGAQDTLRKCRARKRRADAQ